MTETLFLSRARLRKDAPSAALAEIFLPEDTDQRISISHKLMWTLFSDGPNRRRDFLWREAEPGLFYILSKRHPQDAHLLFTVDPPKVFAPALRSGDLLSFSLRANPTVARKNDAKRSKRSDVVMNAIKPVAPGERAKARRYAIEDVGTAWLRRQGEQNGFSIKSVRADGYRVLQPLHGRASMRIATLEFNGVLCVTDSVVFLAALAKGFGRAKAFGCGLMLIRRV